jgi:hypothetical protein
MHRQIRHGHGHMSTRSRKSLEHGPRLRRWDVVCRKRNIGRARVGVDVDIDVFVFGLRGCTSHATLPIDMAITTHATGSMMTWSMTMTMTIRASSRDAQSRTKAGTESTDRDRARGGDMCTITGTSTEAGTRSRVHIYLHVTRRAC